MVNHPFRNFAAVLAIFALFFPIFAQQTTNRRPSKPRAGTRLSTVKKPPAPKPGATPKLDPAKEKASFEAALGAATPSEKAELLVKFIADYPKSELKTRAEESLTGARAAMADESLSAGDSVNAVRLFKLAIDNAPKPYSDRLFAEVIATVPANLYWRGFKTEGIELARLIEDQVATDVNKLLLLSTFYLGTENGEEAKRVAEAAIKLDEKNAASHQTLATAQRLNFNLDAAAAAFARAVELDPESTIAKRSLADMKRATGKADEAEKIYRDILTVNEKENQARTGLVLALFDQGKRAEAEVEMAKALEEAPGNVVLLGGVAYWYAANKVADKAVEFARRAIEKEPRYIWSHIALGRGLMLQNKPVEAEQVLVSARKYGNFPTIQYEIASARLAAGFFREAAEELAKSFEVADGAITTSLGGRIKQTAESFTDAIDMERRASIFAPQGADSREDAARLKALVEFNSRLAAENRDEAAIVVAAERFADGSDNMSVHRKLYAANLLLHHDVATEEAVKLSSAAVAGLDRSLDVANPGAAVMAAELYEARNVSFSREDFLLIPEIPKQTLNSLMRGRIEETTGLALLKQGKAPDAAVRFRRALTVFPANSAWWRSAMWNLGVSLSAEGKDSEALDTMVKSYAIDKPNATRYILIEQLWTKVNGTRDGLEDKIGPNPIPTFAAGTEPVSTPQPSSTVASETVAPTQSEAKAVVVPEPTRVPETSPTPQVAAETAKPAIADESAKPIATPELSPSPEVVAQTVKATTLLEISPTPEVLADTVKVTPTPETSPSPKSDSDTANATPAPQVSPSPALLTETVKVTPTPEISPPPEIVSEDSKATPTPESSPPPEAATSSVKPEPNREESSASTVSPEFVRPSPTPAENTISKIEPKKPGAALFEPIIITIPKSTVEEKSARESNSSEEDDQSKSSDATAAADIARPRIVDGKAITGELLPCEIGVSQESISLINNGGSASMLVSIEQGEDIKLVKGASNSPEDIEVQLDPQTASESGRSLYVIKSISEKTGIYQVTFKAPCGKKDVIVRVR